MTEPKTTVSTCSVVWTIPRGLRIETVNIAYPSANFTLAKTENRNRGRRSIRSAHPTGQLLLGLTLFDLLTQSVQLSVNFLELSHTLHQRTRDTLQQHVVVVDSLLALGTLSHS